MVAERDDLVTQNLLTWSDEVEPSEWALSNLVSLTEMLSRPFEVASVDSSFDERIRPMQELIELVRDRVIDPSDFGLRSGAVGEVLVEVSMEDVHRVLDAARLRVEWQSTLETVTDNMTAALQRAVEVTESLGGSEPSQKRARAALPPLLLPRVFSLGILLSFLITTAVRDPEKAREYLAQVLIGICVAVLATRDNNS